MTGLVRLDASALSRMLIGFDRMVDEVETRLSNQTNYPPHNVLKTGDTYEIQLAVSGFTKDEIIVEVDRDHLVISGTRQRPYDEDSSTVYLHRGLATRDFVRIFPLAEHMEVQRTVISNGILSVYITRILPEVVKPQRFEIQEE